MVLNKPFKFLSVLFVATCLICITTQVVSAGEGMKVEGYGKEILDLCTSFLQEHFSSLEEIKTLSEESDDTSIGEPAPELPGPANVAPEDVNLG